MAPHFSDIKIMKIHKKAFSLIIILFLYGCKPTFNEAKIPFWILKKDSSVVYVVGELHYNSLGITKLPQNIKDIVYNIDALGFEVNQAEGERLNIKDHQERPLRSRIPEHLWTAINNDFRDVQLANGVKWNSEWFNKLDPLMAAGVVSAFSEAKSSPSKNPSSDKGWAYLVALEGLRKPVVSLDFAHERNTLWDRCDAQGLTTPLLESTFNESKKNTSFMVHVKLVKDAVKVGDLEKLDQYIGDKTSFKYMNILNMCVMYPRNDIWIPRILDNLTKYNSMLYVVGVGHLVGKNGLLEKLRKEGFTVERVSK
jgi:uncharacterized protein YbaP (TraB family)